MIFNIISTGSKGNAVVLNECILIDCGVPFSKLQEVKQDLKLVLLTHIHSDHFNPATVRSLHRERPTLRFCCCEWMVSPLVKAGVNRAQIDVCTCGKQGYYYPDLCEVLPDPLVHDVQNCCWHIFEDGSGDRAFYATDTGTLDGVSAPGYALYLVEANYKQAELEARLALKESEGVFAYERRAAVTHLSEEQTLAWLAENAGPTSVWVPLHQHEEVKS